MKQIDYVRGFHQIKSELRTKNQITRTHIEIRLWFLQTKQTLFVHDYNDHKKFIEVATIAISGRWRSSFARETFATRVIQSATDIAKNTNKLMAEVMNELNSRYGYFLPGN